MITITIVIYPMNKPKTKELKIGQRIVMSCAGPIETIDASVPPAAATDGNISAAHDAWRIDARLTI